MYIVQVKHSSQFIFCIFSYGLECNQLEKDSWCFKDFHDVHLTFTFFTKGSSYFYHILQLIDTFKSFVLCDLLQFIQNFSSRMKEFNILLCCDCECYNVIFFFFFPSQKSHVLFSFSINYILNIFFLNVDHSFCLCFESSFILVHSSVMLCFFFPCFFKFSLFLFKLSFFQKLLL